MLRAILGVRVLFSATVAACVGVWGLHAYPPHPDDPFLALIRVERPIVFDVLMYGYATVWFTTPFLAASLITSLVAIVGYRYPHSRRSRALPPYPPADTRPELTLVLGETHFARKPGRAPAPTW